MKIDGDSIQDWILSRTGVELHNLGDADVLMEEICNELNDAAKAMAALIELVNAVECSHDDGPHCRDIPGKGNWFDVRNEILG